jgi:hypothetical protein
VSPTLLFGLGLIGLGMFWLSHAIRGKRMLAQAADWPSVDAVILESGIHRSGGAKPMWEARVRYAYHVGGSRLENDRVTPGGRFRASRARAEQRVAKYPVGAAVRVRHDPDDPQRAYLEVGHEAWWLEIIGGIFGLIAGTALMLRAL